MKIADKKITIVTYQAINFRHGAKQVCAIDPVKNEVDDYKSVTFPERHRTRRAANKADEGETGLAVEDRFCRRLDRDRRRARARVYGCQPKAIGSADLEHA